jgi:hypothetical protein
VSDEHALWNAWVIVPFGIWALLSIYDGIRRVSKLTDEAIYRAFAGDERWQILELIRKRGKAE